MFWWLTHVWFFWTSVSFTSSLWARPKAVYKVWVSIGSNCYCVSQQNTLYLLLVIHILRVSHSTFFPVETLSIVWSILLYLRKSLSSSGLCPLVSKPVHCPSVLLFRCHLKNSDLDLDKFNLDIVESPHNMTVPKIKLIKEHALYILKHLSELEENRTIWYHTL